RRLGHRAELLDQGGRVGQPVGGTEQRRRDGQQLGTHPVGAHPARVADEPALAGAQGRGELFGGLVLVAPVGEQDRVLALRLASAILVTGFAIEPEQSTMMTCAADGGAVAARASAPPAAVTVTTASTTVPPAGRYGFW